LQYQELKDMGKLHVHSHNDFPSELGSYVFHNVGRNDEVLFDNVFSLGYCGGKDVPFRASSAFASRLPVAVDHVARSLRPRGEWGRDTTASKERANTQGPISTRAKKLAGWILEVEVPELELREERYRTAGRIPRMKDTLTDWMVAKERTTLPSGQGVDKDFVLISPPEFVDLVRQSKEVKALAETVRHLEAASATRAFTSAYLKREWDRLAGKLQVCGLLFTGASVLAEVASVVGLGVPGAGVIVKGLEKVANRFLARQQRWLVSLQAFNRTLR
jgi:hypothetical protein